MNQRLAEEKDPGVLRQVAQLLERENTRLVTRVVELTRENLALKGLDPSAMQQALLALETTLEKAAQPSPSSSEKRGSEPEEKKAPAKKTRETTGRTEQPALPIVAIAHELPPSEQTCELCGDALSVWEGQTERSDEIHVVARTYEIRPHVQLK